MRSGTCVALEFLRPGVGVQCPELRRPQLPYCRCRQAIIRRPLSMYRAPELGFAARFCRASASAYPSRRKTCTQVPRSSGARQAIAPSSSIRRSLFQRFRSLVDFSVNWPALPENLDKLGPKIAVSSSETENAPRSSSQSLSPRRTQDRPRRWVGSNQIVFKIDRQHQLFVSGGRSYSSLSSSTSRSAGCIPTAAATYGPLQAKVPDRENEA